MFKQYYMLLCIVLFISCKSKNKNDSKVILGHYLFFENRLSVNQTKSCSSCHAPEFAFTDNYRRSVTALGENVKHNAPTLINVSKNYFFDWANPTISTLDAQIKRPLYAHNPIELGFDLSSSSFQEYILHDSLYTYLFKKAFPSEKKIGTKMQIEQAIVAYEKNILSYQSKYDIGLTTNFSNFSESEKNGFTLFKSKKLNCISCHNGNEFTLVSNNKSIDLVYRNIGLYNLDNSNQYPLNDNGIFAFTRKEKDNGKYKISTLRNIALTEPYMHDGSIATLSEVIDIYAKGGRNSTTGDFLGDGTQNIYKDSLIKGFTISEKEKKDIINFLYTLTDSSIFTNKLFKNPFTIK